MVVSGQDQVKKSFAMDGLGSMVLNPIKTNSSAHIAPPAEQVFQSKQRTKSPERSTVKEEANESNAEKQAIEANEADKDDQNDQKVDG